MRGTKVGFSYGMWCDFKKELQRRSGVVILNSLWLDIKPKMPLPWDRIQMEKALIHLSSRSQSLIICPRCRGNLVIDRDIDGYHRRCVQCSFQVDMITPIDSAKRKPSIFAENKWLKFKTWAVTGKGTN